MNTSDQETTAQSQVRFDQMPALAIKVIANPVGFYQDMAKSGGLLDPLAFMIVLSVASGLITAATSLFGFGAAGAMATGLFAIILVPIFVVIFGFIAAAVAFGIWKILGSAENFETAFRCVAYTAAIAPVTALLNLVPYIGSLVSALWPMALLAIASIHVHRRGTQLSWAVFGAIGIVLALLNVGGERTARQMQDSLEDWQSILEEQR